MTPALLQLPHLPRAAATESFAGLEDLACWDGVRCAAWFSLPAARRRL